jgi:ATPase subunit of ABC transporter with duplicated ATPase domains
MFASIVLSNLAWSTPAGRPPFTNLDLSYAAEPTGLVGRDGAGKTTLLRLIAGAGPPPFLILDESTNHLDIDWIEAVEAGLRAYDGALLIVSHDEAFLEAVGVTRRVTLSASIALTANFADCPAAW